LRKAELHWQETINLEKRTSYPRLWYRLDPWEWNWPQIFFCVSVNFALAIYLWVYAQSTWDLKMLRQVVCNMLVWACEFVIILRH
jgi:hypothetical protein